MGKEIKYKQVPLTEEEYEEALINKAQLESQLESAKLNLKHLDIDEKNKYSERLSVLNARKSLKDMREKVLTAMKTNEANLEMFSKRVETKMKEEEVSEEDSEEEETEEKKE